MRCRMSSLVTWILLLALMGCRQHLSREVFPVRDEALLADFRSDKPPNIDAYNNLFLYFVQGFETFRTPTGSMATFPGLPSRHGATADGMEGFSRMAPMWGAWVASGRSARVLLPGGETVDLNETFKQGVLSGTNPNSPGYW